jgi:hypothetical protein
MSRLFGFSCFVCFPKFEVTTIITSFRFNFHIDNDRKAPFLVPYRKIFCSDPIWSSKQFA